MTYTDYSDRIEHIQLSSDPQVSVILPTLNAKRRHNVRQLIEELENQSYRNIEIILIKGVSPHGRAINLGVSHAKGRYLLIIDDDSRIPNNKVIDILIKTLQEDSSIAMAGASIVVPPYIGWFQRRATSEFPRFNMKVVNKITDSDMPCHGCCLMPKDIFQQIGGEREDIVRGLDPDLRFRLRSAGYRVVLAPDCWIYHPLPETFKKFLIIFFRNGVGSAYCLKYRPESIVDTDEAMELKDFKPKHSFCYRLIRFPLRLIDAIVTLRFLRFIAYCVYALGFSYGTIKYSFCYKIDHKDESLLKKYLLAYHWDPAKAILRAVEASLMSQYDFKEPVLDLGCGDGIFTSVLLSGRGVFGLDIKQKNIAKARTRNFYRSFVVCDACGLAFRNRVYKTVLINSFLEHIPQQMLEKVLSEANRVLSDDGEVFITVNTASFGNADPVIKFMKAIRLYALVRLWQDYRNRRLALFSLNDSPYWEELFKKTNFQVIHSGYYFPYRPEKSFFLWTDIQYLGVGYINIGAAIRAISKLLSSLGIDVHKKFIASVFARLLKNDYETGYGRGSCLFFILRKK